ncbi:arginase family protein, partial [Cronobacter dublinensis]|uniref:arginase family protein n=1 Tax=Cronobacter dublinensis TaxID=413497 RepID=UPI001F3D301B
RWRWKCSTSRRRKKASNLCQARQRNACRADSIQVKQVVGDMPVYLTFDIDCLDPAFAPGTGTPVIGGLTSDRALKLLRGIQDLNIVGMDIVEVAPAYDQSDITALAAATLALEMLYIQAAKKGE